MAAATVLAWKSVIKQLQQLTADPKNKSAVSASTSELLALCDEISSDALPPATVKKLVNELKVTPLGRLAVMRQVTVELRCYFE
jgi:hypothetical protein